MKQKIQIAKSVEMLQLTDNEVNYQSHQSVKAGINSHKQPIQLIRPDQH